MSEEKHMWSYWRNKKGITEALQEQFPETLASSLLLQAALENIRINSLAIDSYMMQLEESARDD